MWCWPVCSTKRELTSGCKRGQGAKATSATIPGLGGAQPSQHLLTSCCWRERRKVLGDGWSPRTTGSISMTWKERWFRKRETKVRKRYEGKHGLIYEVLWLRCFFNFLCLGLLPHILKVLAAKLKAAGRNAKGERALTPIQTGGKYQLDLRLSFSLSLSV